MNTSLNHSEQRILGCLMEKEMATPDYYPLTLNALTNACNQKSNRNPVVSYDEDTVLAALDGLKEKRFVRQSNVSRAVKYEQIFSDGLNMIGREQAIICVLLLRGPQTVGEIRGRTERMYPFNNLEEVKKSIESLEDMELIRMLPKQPGRKESRYIHLLGGDIDELTEEQPQSTDARSVSMSPENDTLHQMQEEIDNLKQEMELLKDKFEQFKAQFE